ncbi:hypothetical protein ACLB2K_014322 [Fragaria x ananassa]
MESVVSHTRKVVDVDPYTGGEVIRHEKVWNFTIADISLLAFGTSFPQISLATIDAIRNIGSLYAGGLGPGTLVGSAAFDLFPIHAVCVVVPKVGELKKIADIGVWLVELFWSFWAYIWLYIILEVWTPNVITLWEALLTVLQYGLLLTHAYAQDKQWPYFSLPIPRSERPEDWVPAESVACKLDSGLCDEYSEILHVGEDENRDVDIFSIHSETRNGVGSVYQQVSGIDESPESSNKEYQEKMVSQDHPFFTLWRQQFVDAVKLESTESRKLNNIYLRLARIFWQLLLAPWRLLFAFVPPYNIAHGWVAFIAFTALAAGTSWPDLVASKIAAERQLTADSAIANITCSNSVNIYVGIGVPWLIDTAYNYFVHNEPLRIENAAGLSFSLLVFFATSVGCIAVLVIRRLTLGAELGGPKLWAWITFVFFMLLWITFVVLSSLKVSGII